MLRTIGKTKNVKSIIKDNAPDYLDRDKFIEFADTVLPETRRRRRKKETVESKWEQLVDTDFVFFKHGRGDASEEHTFNPGTSEVLIVDCIQMYINLSKTIPSEFLIFELWVIAHKEGIITDPRLLKVSKEMELTPQVPKGDYLEYVEILDSVRKKYGL